MNFSLNAEAMVAADAITSWEDACTGQQLPDQELDSYRKHYIAWKVLRDNVNIVYTLASRACRPELDAKFPDEARVSKLVAQVLDLYSMEAPHCEVFDGEMVRSDFRLEALMEARDQDEKFWNQPSEKLRTQVGRNLFEIAQFRRMTLDLPAHDQNQSRPGMFSVM